MATISELASNFLASYTQAMAEGSAPVSGLTDERVGQIAQNLSSHYLPTFGSYTMGHYVTFPPAAEEKQELVKQHLQRFLVQGLGLDIRLKASRVDVLSEYPLPPGSYGGEHISTMGSAVCFVTWEIFPPKESGVEGWHWENVYCYRKMMDGSEGWEFAVSDNEISQLLARFPKFMEG